MARILVIDDDEASRAILRDMLEEAHHEVVEATNGEDGLRLYHQDPSDLLIVDLFMPPEGGLEVIRQLKAASPDIKIIAISGVDVRHELDTVSLSIRYGARRAFNKPLEPEKLQAAIEELLDDDAGS